MKTPAQIILNPDQAYSAENRMWQGVPSVEKTGMRIWAAWFSGGKYEPSIYNYGIVSYCDDGEHWIEPYMILKYNTDERFRVCDPEFWLDSTGRLWLYWVQIDYSPNTQESDFDSNGEELWNSFFDRLDAWGMYTDNPEDETPIWSEPRFLSQGFIRNKPIITKNSTMLIPGYDIHSPGYYQYLVSHDGGMTMEIQNGPAKIGKQDFDEPMIVERLDGSLWYLARTITGRIAEAFSYDGGKTWTETRQSQIPNPCTRFYIGRLPNGMLLLVNTLSETIGDRKSLVASLSTDDGETWSHHLLLDDRRSTTYPDVAWDDTGNIYIIYDCQRDNRQEPLPEDPTKSSAAKEICLAKVTVEDIQNGKLVTPGSYLGKVISKVNYDSRALG